MTSGPFPSPLLLSLCPQSHERQGRKIPEAVVAQGSSNWIRTGNFWVHKDLVLSQVCMNDSSQFLPQISPMTSIMMLLCHISNQTKTLYGWVFSAVETVNWKLGVTILKWYCKAHTSGGVWKSWWWHFISVSYFFQNRWNCRVWRVVEEEAGENGRKLTTRFNCFTLVSQ